MGGFQPPRPDAALDIMAVVESGRLGERGACWGVAFGSAAPISGHRAVFAFSVTTRMGGGGAKGGGTVNTARRLLTSSAMVSGLERRKCSTQADISSPSVLGDEPIVDWGESGRACLNVVGF